MMALMVIMALWPLISNLLRESESKRARNASLIDVVASPQVKRDEI